MSTHDKPSDSEFFELMRRAMVDSQLRPSDVTDRAIVAAMASVPRERFVPADRARVAYTDRSIPLGNGRSLNPPLTVGRMLVAADLSRGDHVLLVGAATGYVATLLSHITAEVIALESDDALADRAEETLGELANVTLVRGPLAKGWSKAAPYTLILVDGAVDHIPDTFAGQLAPGGRLVTALDDRG
ncbi:protein-L-isoaspartate O-methyltransferase, partial [Blastomonas sp.]|uniref:protein-L-isoaspartate O-methyltransferase family protein n=1 Tax=Blastomonas sp. TaxID=1909299 RepID=UPI0035934485